MKIDYNMTKAYCSDWTAIDAIREMVQNAMDSGNEYCCDYGVGGINVTTSATTLPPRVFALGASEKSGDSIGQYGEGFKIGMLVLTRLGLNPQIMTGNLVVTGEFLINEFTQQESFCLVISEQLNSINETVFTCDIDGINLEELEAKLTPFSQESVPYSPGEVSLLKNKPGAIYVKGLFVCEAKLTYGYNFPPNKIQLNRDRNMAGGYDWQLAEYWSKIDKHQVELLFNLLEADAKDVAYVQYNTHFLHNDVRAELARLFFNKYGEGARIGKPGGSYISAGVSCSSSAYSVYSACGVTERVKQIDPNAPQCVLTTFLSDNKRYMRRGIDRKFEAIIERSKGWK